MREFFFAGATSRKGEVRPGVAAARASKIYVAQWPVIDSIAAPHRVFGGPTAERYVRAVDEAFRQAGGAELPTTTQAVGTRREAARPAAHHAVFGSPADFLWDGLLVKWGD